MTRKMPPCPHCGTEVRNVEVETLGLGWSAADLTEFPARIRYYRLRPCGHDVRGYKGDSFGNISGWRS